MIRVTSIPNPLNRLVSKSVVYEQPMTVSEALSKQDFPDDIDFICRVDDYYILREDNWDTYMIPDGSVCIFMAHPSGGGQGGKKNPLATVLMVLVLIIVTYMTFGTATMPLSAAWIAAEASVSLAMVNFAVMLGASAAMYAINAALPPTFPKEPPAPDSVYNIGSRGNQAKIGSPIEVQLGRMKTPPSISVRPYTEYTASIENLKNTKQNSGSQKLHEVYSMGWGEFEIEKYFLLDQDVNSYPEIEIEVIEPGEVVRGYPSSIVVVDAVSQIEMVYAAQGAKSPGRILVSTIQPGGLGKNCVQTVTISGYFPNSEGPGAVSSKFRLSMTRPRMESPFDITVQETDLIPYPRNAPTAIQVNIAKMIQQKLEALPNIGAGNVIVDTNSQLTTGLRVEFVGALAGFDIPLLEVTDTDQLALSKGGTDWDDKMAYEYPYWGDLYLNYTAYTPFFDTHSLDITVGTEVGGDGVTRGFLTLPTLPVGATLPNAGWQGPATFGATGSLVGYLMAFRPSTPTATGLTGIGRGTFADQAGNLQATEGSDLDLLVVTICANTENTVYWEIPAEALYLRDPHGNPRLPLTKAENEALPVSLTNIYRSHFHIVDLNNWMGPFKINGTTASSPINRIAIDIVLPNGHYHTSTSAGNLNDALIMWRIEYQELDDYGDPVDGVWRPITYDNKYVRSMGEGDTIRFPREFWRGGANVGLGGSENSPVRFTLNFDVPEGRYQVRMANVTDMPGTKVEIVNDVPVNYHVKRYPYQRTMPAMSTSKTVQDFLDDSGDAYKSYWTGLRGYYIDTNRGIGPWEGRTSIRLTVTASQSVNDQTLQQFSVLATRKQRDYIGPVDDGVLPASPFTTWFETGTIYDPESLDETLIVKGNTIAVGTLITKIMADGISDEFDVGDYLRISNSSATTAGSNPYLNPSLPSQNGVYQVVRRGAEYVEIKANTNQFRLERGVGIGSFKVRSKAPIQVGSISIPSAHTIRTAAAGVDLRTLFSAGDECTLTGLDSPYVPVKSTVTAVLSATDMTVEATLVVGSENAGTVLHSAPPNGLIGGILDGALLHFTGATAVGGISADAINCSTKTNASVVFDGSDSRRGKRTIHVAGAGSDPKFVVGANVVLEGWASEKNNRTTTTIVEVSADSIRVKHDLEYAAATAGNKIIVGGRAAIRTADTEFYFMASEGATSYATGGGSSVSYKVNEWTAMQPSRLISSALYDLATNEKYGVGLPFERVGMESLRSNEAKWDARDRYLADGITWKRKTLANPKGGPVRDYCDTKLSTRKIYNDVNQEIARCGRARVIYPSGVLTVIRDEPRPVSDGMFNSMNIVGGDIEIDVSPPTEETPDYILVQFYNEDLWDYDEVICSIHNEYLPYQMLNFYNVPVGTEGTFNLSFRPSENHSWETLSDISGNVTASELQALLESLTSVTPGDLVCSGTNPITITYAGNFAGRDLPLIRVDYSNLLTGKVYVTRDANPDYPGMNPARLQMPMLTQRKAAWREGRYELGSLRKRRLLAAWTTDSEGYIPSYLSKVSINNEIGQWGQHGYLKDYVEGGSSSSFFCSEELDWSAGGTHVIQLRNGLGFPDSDGLYQVIKGSAKNEAVIVGGGAVTETTRAHLCTEHNATREATFYSFGPVGKHSLDVLVTGMRPGVDHRVSLQGYLYVEDGVYNMDDDTPYVSATEAELLDQKRIGPAVEQLMAQYAVAADGKKIILATWSTASWATLYHVEISRDRGQSWQSIDYTTRTYLRFPVPTSLFDEEVVMPDVLCGEVRKAGARLYKADPDDEGAPASWTYGEFVGKYVKPNEGVYAGRFFKIKKNGTRIIVLYETPAYPLEEGQRYDIVDREVPVEWWVSVRAKADIFGPRTIGKVDLTGAVLEAAQATVTANSGVELISYSQESSALNEANDSGVVVRPLVRQDVQGNIVVAGELVGPSHPSNSVSIGLEVLYTSTSTTVLLPEAPRTWSNGVTTGPSLVLLKTTSAGTSVLLYTTGTPGAGQYSLSGYTVTLGEALNEEDRVHYLMVHSSDTVGYFAGLHLDEPLTFSNGTHVATLGYTPVNPEEVVLLRGNDTILTYTEGTPGDTEFSASGATLTLGGSVLLTGEKLRSIGVSDVASSEAKRLRLLEFYSDSLPGAALYPDETCILLGGFLRTEHGGPYGYAIARKMVVNPEVSWGAPFPAAGSKKIAIFFEAAAPAPEITTYPNTSVVVTGTNYTATLLDYRIEFTAASDVTCALPTAVGHTGKEFRIKNSGSGTVTITTGGGTIDGSASFHLRGGLKQAVTLYSNGTDYRVE